MLNHLDFDRIASTRPAETREFAGTGGGPTPQALVDDFEARAGVPLLEDYGCIETSPVVVLQPPDEPARPGSVGKAVWGVEVRIVDADCKPLPTGGQRRTSAGGRAPTQHPHRPVGKSK